MAAKDKTMHSTRWLNVAWGLLLCATGITYLLGEAGLGAGAGPWVVLVLACLTLLKGVVVVQVFLEMRHAPALWRWLLLGWLGLVLALIAVAYAMGRA
jgi:uncharacterized membrane protein HdeD (DUF308 family)